MSEFRVFLILDSTDVNSDEFTASSSSTSEGAVCEQVLYSTPTTHMYLARYTLGQYKLHSRLRMQ